MPKKKKLHATASFISYVPTALVVVWCWRIYFILLCCSTSSLVAQKVCHSIHRSLVFTHPSSFCTSCDSSGCCCVMKRSRDVDDTAAAAAALLFQRVNAHATHTHTERLRRWCSPSYILYTLSHTHRHRNVRQIGFRSAETAYIVKQRYRNAYVYKYDTI